MTAGGRRGTQFAGTTILPGSTLLWLAAALAGLGALLSVARWPVGGGSRPALEVVLIDLSDSARRPRPGWTTWIRDELAAIVDAARAAEREVCVVGFADGVATLHAPGPAEDFAARLIGTGGRPFDPLGADLPAGASDLVAGLERARDLVREPERAAGRVTLVGVDGLGARDPGGLLAELAAQGVELAARPPSPPELFDARLIELSLPAAPAPGAPLAGLLDFELERGRERLLLDLERSGADDARRLALVGPFGAGRHRRVLDLGTAGDESEQWRVTLVHEQGVRDPFPENDSLARVLRIGGTRTVAVAADDLRRAEAARWIASLPDAPGLEFELGSVRELDTRLDGIDAVLLWDPDWAELPHGPLVAAVGEGAGLITFDGFRAIPRRVGVADGRLLALEPDRGRRPPREVLLLVDGSGSMAGEAFERVRRAAVELAAAVPVDDRLRLRFFTGVLRPAVSLDVGRDDAGGGRGRAEVAARVLEARAPSGPTALLASLEQLAAERAEDAGGEALVLLLTDGREQDDPIDEQRRRAALVEAFAATRTELRALAVGERADLSTLEPLVREPAHLVRVEDGADLAELVVRTALSEELERGPRALVLGAGELALEVFGAGDLSLPSLERWLPSRLAPGAEAGLRHDGGGPVLGLAGLGLGRVATLAGPPSEDWNPSLAASPGALLPLVRWAADGPRGVGPRVRVVERVDGRRELRLEGLAPDAPPDVRVRLADGTRLTLRPTGVPGRTDERCAAWPEELRQAAGSPVGLVLESLPNTPWRVVTSPVPLEAARRRPLPELPAATPAERTPERRPHPAAPWILGLGLALAAGFGIRRALAERGVKGSASPVR